jgi:hypothetical protein
MRKNTSLILVLALATITIFFFSCQKGINEPVQPKEEIATTANKGSGATQISGMGSYAATGECNAEAGQGASFALTLTGDLNGCVYVFVDNFECSPSGTYREEGREYFVGTYNGQPGTFRTTYKFEAKYEHCDGGPLGAEIFGRCQHPIVAGSGTGVFGGVTGQLNYKDDIEAGNFPYRGYLQF